MDGKKFLSGMQITSLPFYYNSHHSPDNGGKPHVMPFFLEFDENLRLVKQGSTPELDALLREVYTEGSLVDGSISSESGLHYVDPILDFILSAVELNESSRILEIGFGEGIFLKRLKSLGYKYLYGIEPGNHKVCDGLEGVRLISDFYPSAAFTERVDLIFHSLVLEHIQNPVEFLLSQKAQLTDKGKIIVIVPNEGPFLTQGDCSSFIHEHFNFFTAASLENVVASAGLQVEKLTTIGGLLAAVLINKATVGEPGPADDFDFEVFLKSVEQNISKAKCFVDSFADKSELAIYVPGRALNLMYLVGNNGSRLVDDNSQIHNKYLPYFTNPVESFDSIVLNPPKAILIFSRTFHNAIKDKCKSYPQLDDCRVLSVDELLTIDA